MDPLGQLLFSGDQISKKAAQHADYVKGFFVAAWSQ